MTALLCVPLLQGGGAGRVTAPGRWMWLAEGMASGLSFSAGCVQLAALTRQLSWSRRGAALGLRLPWGL